MNIVTVTANFIDVEPQHEQIERGRYQQLVHILGRVGKRLSESLAPDLQCFLISTPDFLRAMRSVPHSQIVMIRIFSLASPSEQLVGTVTDENASDPKSYELRFCEPAR